MKTIAYIRVSSDKQNCANQRYEINNYCRANNMPVDSWAEEIISSRKKLENRKLCGILKEMEQGDTLIASEISRLGRSILEIMGILQYCLNKGCRIITIKENYRLGEDLQSKVMAFAFGLAAEIERQLISQRTKESLKRLKDQGKHLGRPYGFKYRKLDSQKKRIQKMLADNIPKTAIAKILGCSASTLHRYLKGKKN